MSNEACQSDAAAKSDGCHGCTCKIHISHEENDKNVATTNLVKVK